MRHWVSDSAPPRRGAFSLVELLVTIGIIGVLLAILLPALGGARGAGRQTVTLSNLRGLAVTFDQYAQRYGDAYPFAPEGT